MIYLLLVARNDQDILPPLLAAVQVASVDWDEPFRVLVVDDGSQDKTADIVSDFEFDLLRLPRRLGSGAALKAGLQALLPEFAASDIVITLPTDELFAPAMVATFLPLLRGEHDAVVVSRFAPGDRFSLSTMIARWGNRLLSLLFPIPNVSDPASRFHAYRTGLVQELASRYGDDLVQQSGDTCWLEMLLKLIMLGHTRFAEVPRTVPHDPHSPTTKEGIGRTLFRILNLIRHNWHIK